MDNNPDQNTDNVPIRTKKFYAGITSLIAIGLFVLMAILAPEFTMNLLMFLYIFG